MTSKEPIGKTLLGPGKVIMFCCVAVFCSWLVVLAYIQGRSVTAAFRHADVLRVMLSADSRYDKVDVHGESISRGKIFIRGCVDKEQDLFDLKEMVLKTDPPVEVVSWVKILDPTVNCDPSPFGHWTWFHEPGTKWNQQVLDGRLPRVPTNSSSIFFAQRGK